MCIVKRTCLRKQKKRKKTTHNNNTRPSKREKGKTVAIQWWWHFWWRCPFKDALLLPCYWQRVDGFLPLVNYKTSGTSSPTLRSRITRKPLSICPRWKLDTFFFFLFLSFSLAIYYKKRKWRQRCKKKLLKNEEWGWIEYNIAAALILLFLLLSS